MSLLAQHAAMMGHGGQIGATFVDDYVTAAGAWSAAKQLIRGYSGPLIRVRRSSDNTEQDIGLVGGVLDIASLLSFVGAGSGFVTTIYEQVGGSLNPLAGTSGSSQPRIVNAGVLEPNFAQHNGVGSYMSSPLPAGGIASSAVTLFAKIRIDTTNSNGQYGGAIDLGYNTTSRGFSIYSETRALTGAPGVVFAMSGGGPGPYMQRSFKDSDRAAHGAVHLFTVRYDLASSATDDTALHAFMDGSDDLLGTPATGNPTGTFNAATLYTGRFTYGQHYNKCGLHSLVLVAGDVLSQRAGVEAVLQ